MFTGWKTLASALCLLLVYLGGCASPNEGAVSYRAYTPASTVPAATQVNGQGAVGLHKKYALVPDEFVIHDKDTVTIFLSQAFIAQFIELPALLSKREVRTRGEIAIVASVFEFGDTGQFDFTPKAVEKGRLVYYGDDVREYQMLNFSNLPIYGPCEYKGGLLGIQLYIIELDQADTSKLSGMLKQLAQLGTAAYAPASPALGLLEKLGSALLAGSQDDIIFRYSMTLHTNQYVPHVASGVLAAGDYALVKHQDRRAAEHLPDLRYDPEEGRLVYAETQADGAQREYRENTYLVLKIIKNFPASQSAVSQQTLGELQAALGNAAQADATAITQAAAEVSGQLIQGRTFERLRRFVVELRTTGRERLARRIDISGALVSGLAEQIGLLKDCAAKSDAPACSGKLTGDQVDYLLDEMRSIPTLSGDLEAQGKLLRDSFPQDDAGRKWLAMTLAQGRQATQ